MRRRMRTWKMTKPKKKKSNPIIQFLKELIKMDDESFKRKKELKEKYEQEMHQYKLDSIKDKVKVDANKPSMVKQIIDKTIISKEPKSKEDKHQLGDFFYKQ